MKIDFNLQPWLQKVCIFTTNLQQERILKEIIQFLQDICEQDKEMFLMITKLLTEHNSWKNSLKSFHLLC